jgi:hypothetical protein
MSTLILALARELLQAKIVGSGKMRPESVVWLMMQTSSYQLVVAQNEDQSNSVLSGFCPLVFCDRLCS